MSAMRLTRITDLVDVDPVEVIALDADRTETRTMCGHVDSQPTGGTTIHTYAGTIHVELPIEEVRRLLKAPTQDRTVTGQ